MASNKQHRALIVNDEEPVRKLITRALRKQAFLCDVAADGDEAALLAAQTQYDVVITDLKMPNKNGHTLASELLQHDNRPLIVVHTGVVDAHITKDLLLRGVDDILFKPTDYAVLAAKIEGMVERRSRPSNDATTSVQQARSVEARA